MICSAGALPLALCRDDCRVLNQRNSDRSCRTGQRRRSRHGHPERSPCQENESAGRITSPGASLADQVSAVTPTWIAIFESGEHQSLEPVARIRPPASKTLVDVKESRVPLLLKKLNGIQFKGRKLLVKVSA